MTAFLAVALIAAAATVAASYAGDRFSTKFYVGLSVTLLGVNLAAPLSGFVLAGFSGTPVSIMWIVTIAAVIALFTRAAHVVVGMVQARRRPKPYA